MFCFGQLMPLQSSYRNNWQVVNPAAIDRAFFFNVEDRAPNGSLWTLNARNQWTQLGAFLGKAPSNILLSWEYWSQNISQYSGIRIGAQLQHHSFGAFSNTGLYVPLTYRALLDRDKLHSLFIGISPGVQLLQIDQNDLVFEQAGDPTISLAQKKLLLNLASVGVFYTKKWRKESFKTFYAGISIPPGISRDSLSGISFANHIKTTPIYFLSGSFFKLRRNTYLEPSVFVRYLNRIRYTSFDDGKVPVSADVNLRIHWGDGSEKSHPAWVGLGWGTNKMVSTEVGFHLPGSPKIRLNLIGMWVLSGSLEQRSGVELTLNLLNFAKVSNNERAQNPMDRLRKKIRGGVNGKPRHAYPPH